MSTMKKCVVKYEDGTAPYDVHVETYESTNELVNDCKTRPQLIKGYDMSKVDIRKSWQGVDNYDEALELLRIGYQPTVERLKVSMKDGVGVAKRIKFENSVYGFAPVVPLALNGVPNCMIDMHMKQIKSKVVDVYYDMGVSSFVEPEEIIEAGQKLLGTIVGLEKSGYRFNLYALQSFSGHKDADVLCVKVKSSDKPIDLKRISFPLTHPAFFRVIGFDWEGKSPIARDRGCGRGTPLKHNVEGEHIKEFTKQVFGSNAVYVACSRILDAKEDYKTYIQEALIG